MILPAMALFAKPMACSLTDAMGIHKQFLIGSLAVYLISFGSLGILPFFKDPQDHSTDRIAWYIICVLFCGGYLSSACICCMNDALASNYARKNNLNYGRMRVWANLGWAAGAIVILILGDVSWAPFRVPGIILLVVFISSDIVLLSLWPYSEDFEMFHDGTTVEQRKLSIVGPNTLALMAQKKSRGSISKDMLERIRAGRSKSVGNLPRSTDSISHISIKGSDDLVLDKKKEKEQKEYSNFECQMILIKMIASAHKSFLRYIFLFTIFGVIQGVVWTFQLAYFKDEIVKDNAEFEMISTLSMIVQSFLGEILINLVASELLRLFGSNANMSLALVTIGLRCYYYSNLLPYLGTMSVILPEALQGPSLGMYWILIVDVGSNYALMVPDFMPELKRRGIVRDRAHEEELSGCLRASMIGAMSSSMEGLGVALGSFVGGILSDSLGYKFMWNVSALLAFTVGLLNIGWDVASKLVFNRRQKQKQQTTPNNLSLPRIVVEESAKL